MSITLSTTTISTVTEFLPFSNSVTVTYFDDVEGVDKPSPIDSVTASILDPGVTFSFSTGIVQVQGQYKNAFPGKTFNWIPANIGLSGRTDTETTDYSSIPPEIYTLVKYSPAMQPSITIVYTVNTKHGNASFTQTVNNEWTKGRDAMLEVLSRSILK